MDLGGWLRSLGLERYEAAFRDRAVLSARRNTGGGSCRYPVRTHTWD
jgi:hypothetical protein